MSGRFMNVRRIVIPVMAAIILVSQLMGCAAVSSKEMLDMIDQGQTIELVVNQPKDAVEQGEKIQDVVWIQLDQLKTYNKGFRQSFDELLNIRIITDQLTGEGSKTGCIFVGVDNKHDGNSTLCMAFANKTFANKYWNNEELQTKLAELADEAYSDVDINSPYALQAVINAYYNLLNDNENPDSFNPTSSVSREEFYTSVVKAFVPVYDIVETDKNKIERYINNTQSSGEYAEFASIVADYGFLDPANESLDKTKAQSSISRIEAVYLLMNSYLWELKDANIGNITFSVAKNAGDLALTLGFKTQDTVGNTLEKPQWEAYTLASMFKNPNDGIQQELYEALALAKHYGIISGSESRWDETLTRSEAIDMIVNACEAWAKYHGYISTSEYGTVTADEYKPPVVEDTDDKQQQEQQTQQITLKDLSKTQLGYFESIVELEKPAEYVYVLCTNGFYPLETNIGYNLREQVTNYLHCSSKLSSLHNSVTEYIMSGLLPVNGTDLFVEWFKATDEYKESVRILERAYEVGQENLHRLQFDGSLAPDTTQTEQGNQGQQQEQQGQQQQAEVNLNKPMYTLYNVKARLLPLNEAQSNGVISAGTKIILNSIDSSNNWCKVTYNNNTYYVLREYLSETAPVSTQTPTQNQQQQDQTQTPTITGQYSTKTPTGEAIGQYALNRGYNPNDGTFFGGTKEQIGDQYYTTLAGMTVFAPADSLSMEHAQGSKVRITSDMENIKNYVTADEYEKLQSDLDWVYKNTGIGKNAPEVLMLVCLPDGSYILNAGPHNTDVWIDPNDSSCKYVYDEYGCLATHIEWPDLYPGTTYREQIVNDQNGGAIAPPSVYKADAIIAGDKKPNLGNIGLGSATVMHAGKY